MRSSWVGIAVLVAALGGCAQEREAETIGHQLITPSEAWESYPSAQVRGLLQERAGCLLLGDEVAFWPLGSRWDPRDQSVVFEGHPPARVGTEFRGGGGHYPATTDFTTLLGGVGGRAIEHCLAHTHATGVVFAYPSSSAQHSEDQDSDPE